jgi:hypothetical protein
MILMTSSIIYGCVSHFVILLYKELALFESSV